MLYKNKTFEGGSVDIDGNVYDGCNFKDCMLVYRGGDWTFTGPTSFVNVSCDFKGTANNTLQYLGFICATLPPVGQALMNQAIQTHIPKPVRN